MVTCPCSCNETFCSSPGVQLVITDISVNLYLAQMDKNVSLVLVHPFLPI